MANYRDRRVGQEILKKSMIFCAKVRDPRGERNDHRCESYGDLQQATIYYSIYLT